MKILVISTYGESAPLVYRLIQEKHDVYMWIKDEHYKDVMDGFVEKVDNWEDCIDDVDLIIFDDTGFGKESQKLKEDGYAVIGSTEYTDKLELDRGFGQEQFQDAGLEILPSYKFKTPVEAISFVEKNPARYVIKPDGKGGDDKALTYVGKDDDGGDVKSMLEHYDKKFAKNIASIELQEHVEGVEIAVSAFFNGQDFVEPVEISFEHKRLFPGDIGPNTGEMGTTMIWTDFKNKMFKEVLYPMRDRLQGYTGYFDINCIAQEDKLYPLEATCRFGYPTIQLKMETIDTDFGKWLYNLAIGYKDPLPIKATYSCCVVIATPPFPYTDEKSFEKYSQDNMILIKSEDKEGYYPSEVKLEDDQWYIAGQSGYPLVVTGSGESMEDAIAMAYERIEAVSIPNMFYRNDIGAKWQDDSIKAGDWGLI